MAKFFPYNKNYSDADIEHMGNLDAYHNTLQDVSNWPKRRADSYNKGVNKFRSKNPVKKKRSAKQLANDKRLGRMAKARHAAKRKKNPHKKSTLLTPARRAQKTVMARRVKKKAKRKTSVKTHLQLVFSCKGNLVRWLIIASDGKWNWVTDKGKAILFKTKTQAANVARGIAKKPGYAAWQLGVVNANTTAAQIRSVCTKGK